MGLSALALEQTPAFPTYPRVGARGLCSLKAISDSNYRQRMTDAEVSSGLVLPYGKINSDHSTSPI